MFINAPQCTEPDKGHFEVLTPPTPTQITFEEQPQTTTTTPILPQSWHGFGGKIVSYPKWWISLIRANSWLITVLNHYGSIQDCTNEQNKLSCHHTAEITI